MWLSLAPTASLGFVTVDKRHLVSCPCGKIANVCRKPVK
jgi:hypothetical protein